MVTRAAETPDVRTRALASATRLFANQGFDGTSLQEIADEVGVSKPAVLHHFPSKEDLRRAVLDGILDHWREALPRLLLAATASTDRFEAVFGALQTFFTSDSDRARLLARELLDRPAEVRKMLRGPVRPWLGAIAGYIDNGKKSGRHFDDVDAEAYVILILLLVVSSSAAASVGRAAMDGDGTSAASPQRGQHQGDSKERFERELARIARASLFKRDKSR